MGVSMAFQNDQHQLKEYLRKNSNLKLKNNRTEKTTHLMVIEMICKPCVIFFTASLCIQLNFFVTHLI